MESRSEQLSPLVRRLLAPNPSPFTFTGTQTHIVGRGRVAVVDPGPDLPQHVETLLEATAGEEVVAIMCTHTHRDHSPAARLLQQRTGAPIVGCAPLVLSDEGPRADAAFDAEYGPDKVLSDGEMLEEDGWSLEAVATPGHTSNHLCFALREERALFSGDHVMGWSTSIVSPPDGDMGAYMASLAKLQEREEEVFYPAHGPVVDSPQRLVRGFILHRRQREAQILSELGRGERRIPAMVKRLYAGVDPRLHPAAERSVLAHLLDLQARGVVMSEKEEWQLAS
jgi:glyoxylase-like metal-dependent hydrolase (beta-lactamase superfamily II)